MNSSQRTLVLLILSSITFFGLMIINPLRSYIEYIGVTIFLYYLFPQIRSLWTTTSGKFLCGYFFFFLCSCIYSIVFNHQSAVSMYHTVINYVGIATFAYCTKNNLSSSEVKRVLLVLSFIFCLAYIIQWIVFPTILFRGAADDSWSMERFRMRLPLSLCAFYLFLHGVNQIIDGKYAKAAIAIVLGFIPIIVMGFRSLTFLTIVASVLLYFSRSNMNSRTILGGFGIIVGSFILSQTALFQAKFEEMSNRQMADQTFANDDYIRWIELEHYMTSFDKPGEWLFGGGVPSGTSNYAYTIQSYLDVGLFWQDLGIVGLTFIIGIITVSVLVLWSIRMMLRCGHQCLYVERMTMFIALFGSILTSMEYFRAGNFMILGLLFYIEYIANNELGAPEKKLLLTTKDYHC